MLSNQSIKTQKSNLSIAELTATSVRSHSEIVHRLIVFLFICSTIFFNDCTSILHNSSRNSLKNILLHVKLTRCLRTSHLFTQFLSTLSARQFSAIARAYLHHNLRYLTKTYAFTRQIDAFSSLVQKTFQFYFNSFVMNFFIFAFSSSRYFDCNITLDISHSITISIFSSLKSLFTYDERIASLKLCLKFLETARHFKTVMIVADFSEDDDSDFNYMQCFICSLLLYSEYFTFESLKQHFHETSHCSLVIQLQQEVESKKIVKLKIAEKSKIESFFISASLVKFLNTYEERLASLQN